MNNYPIKYAVLKVEVSDKDIKRTLGYIVSKCYVVESFSRIDKEGNTRNGYKVVFPYNNINNYENTKRNIPYYDANGNAYPLNIVTNLYTDIKRANKIAKLKNKMLLSRLIGMKLLNSNNIKEDEYNIKREFNNNLSECKIFEAFINDNTKDLNITDNNLKILELK